MWTQKTSPFTPTMQCSNYQSAKLTVILLHFPFHWLHFPFDFISQLDTFLIRNVSGSNLDTLTFLCSALVSLGDRFLAWSRHLWTLPPRCRTFVGWGMLCIYICVYIFNGVGNCFCICKMICIRDRSVFLNITILMHGDLSWHPPPPTALIVYSGRICMRQSHFPTLPCCLSSCWHVAIKISLQITSLPAATVFSLSMTLIWAPCFYHFELPNKSGKLTNYQKLSESTLQHAWWYIFGWLVNWWIEVFATDHDWKETLPWLFISCLLTTFPCRAPATMTWSCTISTWSG